MPENATTTTSNFCDPSVDIASIPYELTSVAAYDIKSARNNYH